MPEKPNFEPGYHEETSLRVKILNILAELGIVDRIAQKRAIDIVEKSKIREHLKQDGVYLDVGTGLGHIVEAIEKEEENKNLKFMAVEPVWEPTKKVRGRLKETGKVGFAKAWGQTLPFKDKSFDGVSLFFVLHHIAPAMRAEIFKELGRVLKNDGMIFLVEDTPDSADEKKHNAEWDRKVNFEPKGSSHHYFSDAEWVKFFDENGWELIDYAYFKEDPAPKEGPIHHGSYILRRKQH